MNSKLLEQAGFCQFFKDQYPAITNEGQWQVARITHVYRDQFLGLNEIGDEVSLRLKGSDLKGFSKLITTPVVGDFVVFKENPLASFSLIEDIFKRKNSLERSSDGQVQAMAANVDYGLVCTSLNQNFNLNRIERYIALFKTCQIEPVIILTKADVAQVDINETLEELKNRFPVVRCFVISMKDPQSILELQNNLDKEKTIVLLGSSGVGKSSLTNFLIGKEIQKISDIREDDSKGRHTTVSRSMHLTDYGVVIDTPGMRGLSLGVSTNEVMDIFEEIQNIILECRFSNCSHQDEPGCKVNEKLETGELSHDRYANFQKMLREAAYLERKTDINAYLAAKKEWKKVVKLHRS